jgi:hypothetical protein
MLAGLMSLQWLILVLSGICFLAGPAALQWKISMGLLFILLPMIAAALVMYRTMGSGGGSYESSPNR